MDSKHKQYKRFTIELQNNVQNWLCLHMNTKQLSYQY